jgi:hypothetical protein
MVTRTTIAVALALSTWAVSSTARADTDEPAIVAEEAAAEEPAADEKPAASKPVRVHHRPVALAAADEPLGLMISVEGEIEQAHVVYRVGSGKLHGLAFGRANDPQWKVSLPASALAVGGFGYAIEIAVLVDGELERRAVFASREALHRVQVTEDSADIVERRLLARADGRRSEVSAFGEWVSFGESVFVETDTPTGAPRRQLRRDGWWRVEGRYDYRFFGFAHSLGMRAGVIRADAPVPAREDAVGDERFEAGFNYVAPEVRLRYHEVFHMDAGLTASVSDDGFAFGGSGALHVGRLDGMRLTLAMEGLQRLGIHAAVKVQLPIADWLALTPTVALTNYPAADRLGLRLLSDVTITPGAGFTITARGGYQTRVADGGGATVGGGLGYAF